MSIFFFSLNLLSVLKNTLYGKKLQIQKIHRISISGLSSPHIRHLESFSRQPAPISTQPGPFSRQPGPLSRPPGPPGNYSRYPGHNKEIDRLKYVDIIC